MQIAQAKLRTMLEETSARAASEALARFLESQQNDKAEKIPDKNGLSTANPKEDAQKKTANEAKTPPRNSKKKTTQREDEAQSQAHSTPMNEEEKSLEILPTRRSPFTTAILAESLPKGMKIINIPEYEGAGDPQVHLYKFYVKADLYDISNAAYCKIFRTTLSGRALSWFNKLPFGTIENLEQLTQRFLHQFSINKKYPKTGAYLFTIIQKEGEGLRDYVQRFTQAVHEVPHVNHDLLAGIIQQNLQHRNFKESIARKPSTTLEELLARAEKYIRIEESIEPRYLGKRKREEEKPKIRGKMIGELFKPPTPREQHKERGDTSKKSDQREVNMPTGGTISVIVGGPACGDTNNAWKNLACATSGDHPYSRPVFIQIVHEISRPSEEVSFGNADLETSRDEHKDALIISATIFNFWVKNILVDYGSSAEIILTGHSKKWE
ncbi:uncharacterized protein [Henckelia pumila]|uniref:uncharacterized protein n=1 Tax=Henckelia pumila TaxID=405737 RepID=UPI003C6E68BD